MTSTLIRALARTDLNLLIVLHALLETGSTVAAGDAVGRTQSAVSHALGRLRETFDDPLFIRHGSGLKPTPLAEQLRQPLVRLLHDADTLLTTGGGFDPATASREIVIAAPDICLALVLAVADAITAEAPGIRVRFDTTKLAPARLIAGETDLVLSFYRTEAAPGVDLDRLGSTSWASYARSGHPLGPAPTLAQWAAADHVQVATGSDGRSPVSDALAGLGATRRIRLQVGHFLQALHVAAETDCLFTTLAPFAEPVAARLGLVRIALPFAVPDVPLALMTRARRHDPMSAWLGATALSVIDHRP